MSVRLVWLKHLQLALAPCGSQNISTVILLNLNTDSAVFVSD